MDKPLNIHIVIASGILLLALVAPVSAGTVTITSGPTFIPESAFTNNTFTVQVIHDPPGVSGDLLQGGGGATVIAPPSNSVTVEIAGTFTANAGDRPSVAYSVTIDANAAAPISYTASANVTFLGVPQAFNDMGTITPGLHRYTRLWQAPVAFPISGSGTWSGTLTLNFPVTSSPAGAPPALGVSIDQFNIQLANTAATVPPPSKALNVSTRLRVLTDSSVLIGGFIVTGTAPKRVLIRGIGPSLASFFSGVLEDPTLELYQGSTLLQSNNDWRSDQEAEIQATGIPPSDSLESAIIRNLDPGGYTAIVRGNGNTTGIGLVEAYDVDHTVNSKLGNISTRGFIDTGNNVMIGGFILGPNTSGSSTVVLRGIGPSLGPLGIPDPLQDPLLSLHDGNGALIASNDNWMDNTSGNRQTIIDLGLAPSNNNESALLAIPAPGNYTAILSGVNNTTGVGLVEVYHP